MKNFLTNIFFPASVFFQIFTLNLEADGFRRIEELNPHIPLTCRTVFSEVSDDALVNRVVSAYQLAYKQHLGNSMWQLFFDQKHYPIHQIFEGGQLDKAALILRNPGSTDLFYGIDNLASSLLPLYASYEYTINMTITCMDSLLRFGEAIGAVTLDNPEGYYNPPRSWDVASLIEKLESHLNVTLNFPNPYPDEFGLWTSRGVVSYRVPQALYQAYLIKTLVKGIKNPRVLEIGAGVGRTAYYARLFGINDYTIIDIPMTGACSGYFLGRTLGEEAILLLGETCNNPENRVKILTPNQFINNFDQKYDLIINVDSLTEMDISVARSYVSTIENITPIFVSINHEVNPFTTRQLINQCSNVKNIKRSPYWMRHGYVEEIVEFEVQ